MLSFRARVDLLLERIQSCSSAEGPRRRAIRRRKIRVPQLVQTAVDEGASLKGPRRLPFVHQRFASQLGKHGPIGVRRSHLSAFVSRWRLLAEDSVSDERTQLEKELPKLATRLSPFQLVDVLFDPRARNLLDVPKLMQTSRCAECFSKHPVELLKAVEKLSSNNTVTVQHMVQVMAQQFFNKVAEYGQHSLPLFVAFADAGKSAFRRVPDATFERCVKNIGETSGVLVNKKHAQRAETSTIPRARESTVVSADASVEDISLFFTALSMLEYRDLLLMASLSKSIAGRWSELGIPLIPRLAKALQSARTSIQPSEFVLLHALGRKAAEVADELDGPSAVLLLQAMSKCDMYDEEFLEAISGLLQRLAPGLTIQQLADSMYALGALRTKEVVLLDALCRSFGQQVDKITHEAVLVRFLRGMVKLRHYDENLLSALAPQIDKMKTNINPASLTNIISSIAAFETTNAGFMESLLDAACNQIGKIPSMSIQHILTAVFRQQSVFRPEVSERYLSKICIRVSNGNLGNTLTAVQCVASMTALSKLHYRHLPAISVFFSALAGRGNDIVWHWAPSACFYAHGRDLTALPKGTSKFNEGKCAALLNRELDGSHCVDILQSMIRLELNSALVYNLSLIICRRLLPLLHEMKARDILIVARSIGETRIPVDPPESFTAALTAGGSAGDLEENTEVDENSSGRPLTWREKAVVNCFENLRRHEHWLNSSWANLLPLKLLCHEIDQGIFGTRRLDGLLSESLEVFVSRLRSLTWEQCEENRLNRDGASDRNGSGTPEAQMAPDGEGSVNPGLVDGTPLATIPQLVNNAVKAATMTVPGPRLGYRMVTCATVGDFPVDVLIERIEVEKE